MNRTVYGGRSKAIREVSVSTGFPAVRRAAAAASPHTALLSSGFTKYDTTCDVEWISVPGRVKQRDFNR
jgi:hypothetical protein